MNIRVRIQLWHAHQPGLLPSIEAGNIASSMKGSRHCPIWVDLREEIEVDIGGKRVKGVKEMHEVVMRDERVDDGVAGEKDMSRK